MEILVPSRDHEYASFILNKEKVVWNSRFKYYKEYIDEYYLTPDEEVVERIVAR